ncbi:MAG: 6-hydroxynicotinate reductase [Acidimicrobiales bacterium]
MIDATDTTADLEDSGEGEESKIRCEACPIRCFIKPGQTGSCDRYGNVGGVLTRMDPVTVLERTKERGGAVVPFVSSGEWDGQLVSRDVFVTGAGAGTTYPDYKPAPLIVSSDVSGVDTITVVTEGIFSYCSARVKIDTDRYIGPEQAVVRSANETVGAVTTGEYGSQMLSIGGVNHLTGGTKHEGLATMRTLLALCKCEEVDLVVDGGSHLTVQAGAAPIIDGEVEQLMRVGCGSATVGMFAKDWSRLVDEVVVVDDHITGVLTEHQAGAVLGMAPSGIKVIGRRSTPGRYFNIAEPGAGWGGTTLTDPLAILGPFRREKGARPGLRLLMVSTTGESSAYYVLDDDLLPQQTDMPVDVIASVSRIRANCEPALTSVLFVAGAGGSLRAGVTTEPIRLTRSVRSRITRVTCGGAPVYIWPGGGITFMVDVTMVPKDSFGFVPTPAIVAPIEFTMPRQDYLDLGGHGDAIRRVEAVLSEERVRLLRAAGTPS